MNRKEELFFVFLLVLVVFVSGCAETKIEETVEETDIPYENNNEGIDLILLDKKDCETDNDCIVTTIGKFDCCASCRFEGISKIAFDERDKWMNQNCNEWGPKVAQMFFDAPKRYHSCMENGECPASIGTPICENNKCEINEQ